MPWSFLTLFGAAYLFVLVPKLRDGHPAALCLGAFVGLVFVCFGLAAVTFSRDVLTDRWPD